MLKLNPRAILGQVMSGPSKLWSCSSLLAGQGAMEKQGQPELPVPRVAVTLYNSNHDVVQFSCSLSSLTFIISIEL